MGAGLKLWMIAREVVVVEEKPGEDLGAEADLDPEDPRDQGLGPEARGAGQGLQVGRRAGPEASLVLNLEASLELSLEASLALNLGASLALSPEVSRALNLEASLDQDQPRRRSPDLAL